MVKTTIADAIKTYILTAIVNTGTPWYRIETYPTLSTKLGCTVYQLKYAKSIKFEPNKLPDFGEVRKVASELSRKLGVFLSPKMISILIQREKIVGGYDPAYRIKLYWKFRKPSKVGR